MDLGPNRSTATTTAPPPPVDADITEHDNILAELQVLPATAPTTAEPPLGNSDQENEGDVQVPLGVKLTTYRLLNLVVIFAFGLAKFIWSLKGQRAAPTGLEWAVGTIFGGLSYWIGLYERVQPPRWEWLLHVDLAPAIGFITKCFLAGVLQAFSVYWEVLPFCLFVSIPLLVLSRITAYALEQNLYHFLLAATVVIVSFLIIFLPEKWWVWKRMWVWDSVRRFFRDRSNDPKSRQYPLWGSLGFILGLLSGMILTPLLLTVLVHRHFQDRSRTPPVDIIKDETADILMP